MYVYYGLRNKDLNVVFLEELPEPEDRKQQNIIIYEDGAVEFYINVYKTQKSYSEKVLKITDEKFIQIFKEQNLQDFKRLNELQASRGSSLTTILKSYNLYNT